MVNTIVGIALLAIAYLLGSIPWGLIIVKLRTGQDVRKIESGRTGGTNVGRVAGFWAGFFTALLDGLKGTIAVWLSIWLIPEYPFVHALAGVLAIVGHNYSIFLAERTEKGWKLHGGAGGATSVGAMLGLWWPSVMIMIPAGLFMLFVVGYASLATLTVGVTATIIFIVRAAIGHGPWGYVLYGFLATAVLVWSLRPNIRRLLNGTERVVGLRAKRRNPTTKRHPNGSQTI
jgi:glycerol-3-phosphate acyltransferase PlsY